MSTNKNKTATLRRRVQRQLALELCERGVDPNELLSRSDAATALGTSESHLIKLAALRKGPVPTRVGRLVRYRRLDLETYLLEQSGYVAPGADQALESFIEGAA